MLKTFFKHVISLPLFLSFVREFFIYPLDDVKNGPTFTFGYGPFSCVGKHFALMETKVTIVRLLKKFKFTIDPGCDEYRSWNAITLKLYPDLKVRVHAL